MKPLKVFLLSALLVCFSFNNSYAQKTAHAQEMAGDLSKIKNGFEIMEKGLLDAFQANLKDFTATEVQIDRKTGMIVVVGKNSKGTMETLNDVVNSPYYNRPAQTNNNDANAKAEKGFFQSWIDWLFGIEPVEEEHYGDELPDHLKPKKPDPNDVMQHG